MFFKLIQKEKLVILVLYISTKYKAKKLVFKFLLKKKITHKKFVKVFIRERLISRMF